MNVFELVTASLAAEGVELRQEWNKIKAIFTSQNHDLLHEVSGTDFITAMTLWDSYEQSLVPRTDGKAVGVKCKKKDVMNLRRAVFVAKQDGFTNAFMEAARFLIGQGIFSAANLPYNTQYIPLAAIYAFDNSHGRLLHNSKMVASTNWVDGIGVVFLANYMELPMKPDMRRTSETSLLGWRMIRPFQTPWLAPTSKLHACCLCRHETVPPTRASWH